MFGIRRYRRLLVYIEMLFEFKYLISMAHCTNIVYIDFGYFREKQFKKFNSLIL